jgi:hypothetical protein
MAKSFSRGPRFLSFIVAGEKSIVSGKAQTVMPVSSHSNKRFAGARMVLLHSSSVGRAIDPKGSIRREWFASTESANHMNQKARTGDQPSGLQTQSLAGASHGWTI